MNELQSIYECLTVWRAALCAAQQIEDAEEIARCKRVIEDLERMKGDNEKVSDVAD